MSTWVFGDIHGCYDEFMTLLSNPEIKEDDTIILIGDIIDRGKDSFKMLDWAINNITDDGKYQMICGNHEDILIDEFDTAINLSENGFFHTDLEELDISVMDSQYDFTAYMYGAGFETLLSVKPYIDWFRTLPLTKSVEVTKADGKKQKYIIAHAWYSPTMSRQNIVWYRDINNYTEVLTKDYEPTDEEILIHGHTPTIFIEECRHKSVNEVLFRKNSINIDLGMTYGEEYGCNLAAIRLEDEKCIYAKPQVKIKRF